MLTDKMTMAASLECRVPLLDHQLVELAAQIPARIKVARGELKSLMKSALADLLPDDILHREKRGFGAPMGAWLKGALMPLLASALSRQAIEARGVLHYEPVRDLIAAHRANRIDGTDRLLALLSFEIWCQVYLDRRSTYDIGGELAELAA
jgi:asparagine synthase (glutamine-hydrolysing)